MLEYTDDISLRRARAEALRKVLASFSSDDEFRDAVADLPSNMRAQLQKGVWKQLDNDVEMCDQFFDQLGTMRNNLYPQAPCPILSSQTRV